MSIVGRRSRLFVAMGAAVATIAACGSGDDASGAGDPGADGQPATVNVGVVPVTTVAPLYLGIELGFFEEVGLDVVPETVATSPAILAGLVNGELQVGFSATASVLQAVAQGMPITAVVGGSYTSASEPGTGLVAAEGSGIEDVSELGGATVAVNELQGQSELAIRAVAEEAGVAAEEIEFIALPFPEMVAALDAGHVDAAGMVQPFGWAAEDAGHERIVPDYYAELHDELTVTSWFTAEQFASESPEVVERFSEALSRSMEYAIDHPEELQEIIPTFTETSPEVAAELPLAATSPAVVEETIELQVDLMTRYGMLEGDVDVEQYVAEPVRSLILR